MYIQAFPIRRNDEDERASMYVWPIRILIRGVIAFLFDAVFVNKGVLRISGDSSANLFFSAVPWCTRLFAISL